MYFVKFKQKLTLQEKIALSRQLFLPERGLISQKLHGFCHVFHNASRVVVGYVLTYRKSERAACNFGIFADSA